MKKKAPIKKVHTNKPSGTFSYLFWVVVIPVVLIYRLYASAKVLQSKGDDGLIVFRIGHWNLAKHFPSVVFGCLCWIEIYSIIYSVTLKIIAAW